MKTLLKVVAVLSLLGLVVSAANADVSKEEKAQMMKDAKETVSLFREKDPSMTKFFDKSYGYAVFSSVAKGAVGVGGAHGKGLLFHKGEAQGVTSLTQVTVGLQLGGQVYSEIIFFEDASHYNDFTAGKFELSAQATAVAAAAGVSANASYKNGVAIFTVARGGLMYEASVGGQKFGYKPF